MVIQLAEITNRSILEPNTEDQCNEAEKEKIIFGIINLCFVVPILYGNGLVLHAYRCSPKLWVPFNILLVSLATSDLLIGTICTPMISVSLLIAFPSDSLLCPIVGSVLLVPFVASALTLLATAVFRLSVILYPHNGKNITANRMLVFIAALWTYSIAICFTHFAMETTETNEDTCSFEGFIKRCQHFALLIVTHLVLVLAVCTNLYILIGVTVVMRRQKWARRKSPIKITFIELSNSSVKGDSLDRRTIPTVKVVKTHNRLDLRTIKMLAIVLVGMFFCWIPVVIRIIDILQSSRHHVPSAVTVNCTSQPHYFGGSVFGHLTVTQLILGSVLNPLLYAGMSAQFCISFRKILGMKTKVREIGTALPTSRGDRS